MKQVWQSVAQALLTDQADLIANAQYDDYMCLELFCQDSDMQHSICVRLAAAHWLQSSRKQHYYLLSIKGGLRPDHAKMNQAAQNRRMNW